METLNERTVVVAGGTGNIGTFVVKALLERGATVVVPSRSAQKVHALRTYLTRLGDGANLDRLETFIGDVGDENGARELQEQITSQTGEPDAVVATLGKFVPAASLLDATVKDLSEVLRGYLIAHFVVARTFLPGLASRGGTYVFINGPLALEPWKGSGAGLVSIATAAQQMLFKSLAQELEDSNVRVVELMSHAFIRERQTQPTSPIPAEAVGAFVSHLVAASTHDIHGRTIQLRSPEQLENVGVAVV